MDSENFEGSRFLLKPPHEYRLLNEISRGAYGVVYRAWDCEKKKVVAMKREFDGGCSATVAEIVVLQSLPRHPSIVEFLNVVKEGEGSTFVVMEYLENDLRKYLLGFGDEALTLRQIKHVLRRLVEGVAFLHRHGVMHRDLKPDNILIGNTDTMGGEMEVKICDFGSSAPTRPAGGYCFSTGVGSRWYRAPELLTGKRDYTSAVDMWAVGCIMAEMALRRPLFGGKADYDQLPCVHAVISPSDNHIRWKMASEAALSRATSLAPSGLHLIQRLMEYDHDKRITATDALNHAWFAET